MEKREIVQGVYAAYKNNDRARQGPNQDNEQAHNFNIWHLNTIIEIHKIIQIIRIFNVRCSHKI